MTRFDDQRAVNGIASAPAASGPISLISAIPSVATMGGSEIYRLSPDGSPKTIWSSHEDLVYALAFDHEGRLLAGTGNRGRIYVIAGNQYTDLAEASASQVTAFAPAPKGGLYAATSNLGKVFLLGPNRGKRGHVRERRLRCEEFLQVGTCGSARAAATFNSSRAAATSTILIATGASGS